MQIKILNQTFDFVDGSVQLSLGSHATINLSFDLDFCKCESFFIEIYDSKKNFTVESIKFCGKGCFIKSIDSDYKCNKLHLLIHCDVIEPVNKDIRRDDFLNDLLNKTFKTGLDIN